MDDLRGHIYGRLLKSARETAGLTQDQLAERLGISRRTLAHWEAGSKHPEFSRLQSIADALGQSVAWFFQDDPGAEATLPHPVEPTLADLLAEFKSMKTEIEE